MPGLASVISRIREDIDRGSAFDARIRRAIDDAIHYYSAVRFGFNSKRSTFLVSSEYTSLTADWIELDTLTLELSSNEVRPLFEKPYPWIHMHHRDASLSDEPLYFAIQNRQLRLWPPPDQTYSVQMSYQYHLGGVLRDGVGAEFSASDSFSNAWLEEAEQLIRHHATADIYENYIDGPEALHKADRCRNQAAMHLRQLKRRANREQGGGMVEPFI